MTATAKPTKPLAARILIPAVSALVLSWGAPHAAASPANQTLLVNKLYEFALQTAATPAKAPTTTLATYAATNPTLTAPADNLVLAVYQLIQDGAVTNPDDIADLVSTALESVSVKGVPKVRADKDKIVARLVDAAVNGLDTRNGGLTAPNTTGDAAVISKILAKVLTVNKPAVAGTASKLTLTTAGQAAAITQALKDAADPAAGTAVADAAISALKTLATPKTPVTQASLQTFAINALKTVGVNTGSVKSFVAEVLNDAAIPAANRDLVATNVAAALAANPSAAGEAIGAAASLKTGADRDDQLKTLATNSVKNGKLAKALPYVVGAIFEEVSGDRSGFASTLLGTQTKAAGKGSIAAGLLQGAKSGETFDSLVGSAVVNTLAKTADKVAFAAAAAVGNGGNAHITELTTALANSVSTDTVAKTAIGSAIIKAIGATAPEGASAVAQSLIDSTGGSYADTGAKTTLAVALAKAVATNATAAGAAVSGVVSKIGATSLATDAASITTATVKVASKSATSIAMHVSDLLLLDNPTNSATIQQQNNDNLKSYAQSVVNASTPAVAGSIAAGVALTNVPDTGHLTANVANTNDKTRALTLSIANTVATAVDVERVADVAENVSKLIVDNSKSSTPNAKIPKVSTLPTLALSLAKSIQSKPNVLITNRVDELAELAAVMVDQAFNKAAPDVKLISGIGTSILKALSAKFLPNASGRQADQRDAVDQIVGAIAQTISYKLSSGNQTDSALLARLLGQSTVKGDTIAGVLFKAFSGAAKTNVAAISAAFNAVLNAGAGNLVAGNKAIGQGSIDAAATTKTGAYEIGSVIDPETPIKNL